MLKEQATGTHIRALDGWRGVAILLVLIDHAAESAHSDLVHKATRVGATGVGIFLALSGFLITTRLLREHARCGRIDLKTFYIRRVFRLLPPVGVYLTLLAVLAAFGVVAVTKLQLLSSLFLFRSYIPADQGGGGWFTGHFWSLNIEEHFYMMWPVLLLLARRRLLLPIALACSVAAWRYIDITYNVVQADIWLPGRTDVRLDSLLWGCILAIAFTMPVVKDKLRRFLPGLAIVALAAIDVYSNIRNGQHDYSAYEPIILALIVVWPILHPASVMAGLLELKFLKWLGRLSYSLYIWQQLWLLFPGAPYPFGRFQQIPLNLICVFASSLLSYYLVEKPMIQIGHGLTSRQPVMGAPVRTAAQEQRARIAS